MSASADPFVEGWQLHQAGDLRQAEEVYRRLLRAAPRDGRVWFALANLCAAEDRLAEALACTRQAVEIAPDEPLGHLFLGNLLLRQGAKTEAEQAYRRCLELRPEDVEALGNLGFVLEDSPWYPSLRLFLQPAQGDGAGALERMADALRRCAARRTGPPAVLIEVAPGELLDKISILEIKAERITDPTKLNNVRAELEALAGPRDLLEGSAELANLSARLKAVNEQLWDIEDEIRVCERRQDFGPRFIELARAVYRTNDRRAALKRAVNDLLHSSLGEEKSYEGYSPPA
jgi:tetratricopeptide (TPR) repeat protein